MIVTSFSIKTMFSAKFGPLQKDKKRTKTGYFGFLYSIV